MGKIRSKDKEQQPETSEPDGMGSRGVTRPMMKSDMSGSDSDSADGAKVSGHQKHGMSDDERRNMLHMHHMQTLWIYWMLLILGMWMVMSPLTFDYGKNTVEPAGGREVWLSLPDRITAMRWSDFISGGLLIFFAWRSLTPARPISLWICCFIGAWISFAPLIFWAPTAVAYLNGTLVGAVIIALTVLIPGMPNMIMYMKMGSDTPPGWSYNPSSWPQRWIMIVTGFIGWIVSRYLATFQLGYIDHVWDPFFGESSMKVLDSSMSRSFPISDAGLGALAYTFEFLMGFMGSPSRWRTMPWMVALFGILVIPLGLVHIFLVISQPLAVGAWCTFCLLAAGIMLPMIPLEADEVIAMGQHMVQAKRRGEKFWRIFWKGGEPVEMNKDDRSPKLEHLPHKFSKVFLASIWGMSFPWQLVVSALLGVWLVFAPAIFAIPLEAPAADIHHLIGSLILVVAVIAMGEVLRVGRYLNVILGLTIAIVPWFLDGSPAIMNINAMLAGLLVAVLAIPRGVKKETYGLWDRFVK